MSTFNPDEVDDNFLTFAWRNLTPKGRSRVLSKAPKTFWLFGAGASYHCDLNAFGVPVPLSNGFFEAFHRLPTSQGFQARVGPLIYFLEHYRGVAPEQAAKWIENIEDFMTSIETELNDLKESTGDRRFTPSSLSVWFHTQRFSTI